jgi:hypothetical protein
MLYSLVTLLILCSWAIVCSAHANDNPADAFRVDGMKKWGVDEVMFAGMMPLDALPNEDNGSFFFWLAESRKTDQGKNTPLIVWLNGEYKVRILPLFRLFLFLFFCIFADSSDV